MDKTGSWCGPQLALEKVTQDLGTYGPGGRKIMVLPQPRYAYRIVSLRIYIEDICLIVEHLRVDSLAKELFLVSDILQGRRSM